MLCYRSTKHTRFAGRGDNDQLKLETASVFANFYFDREEFDKAFMYEQERDSLEELIEDAQLAAQFAEYEEDKAKSHLQIEAQSKHISALEKRQCQYLVQFTVDRVGLFIVIALGFHLSLHPH